MKTATITWIYYENFGTFLQAYALQKSINNLGHENSIIDDSVFYKPGLTKRIKNKIIDILKGRNLARHKAYRKFAKQHLKIERNFGDIKNIADKYDAYICGSDQIWSPHIVFNPYYYLGFTERKKIAYAPSTGTGTSHDEYKQNVKPFIEKFSHIAVREESGAQMLSSFIDKKIEVVLDPTLLLTVQEWDNVASEIKTTTPYILCYFLTPNKWYLEYVKEYADKHNKNIKIFNTNPIYKEFGFELVDAGPGEFISYIKHAEKVFTDSFHSSIFSIIYHKDFVTFKRFKDGGEKDQNARIANLFKKIGLQTHFIGEDATDNITHLPSPNYTIIDAKLNELRASSLTYLKNAIEK